MLPELSLLMSEATIGILKQLFERNDPTSVRLPDIHSERRRLSRLWSEFFMEYPLLIGPTWTDVQFMHDADLDRTAGVQLIIDRLRFITPANALGLPSVAVPTGIHDDLPTGVQVYAEKWRDDLALNGAEIIESALGQLAPIDPRF